MTVEELINEDFKESARYNRKEENRRILSCFQPTQIERNIEYWQKRGYPISALNLQTGCLRL